MNGIAYHMAFLDGQLEDYDDDLEAELRLLIDVGLVYEKDGKYYAVEVSEDEH